MQPEGGGDAVARAEPAFRGDAIPDMRTVSYVASCARLDALSVSPVLSSRTARLTLLLGRKSTVYGAELNIFLLCSYKPATIKPMARTAPTTPAPTKPRSIPGRIGAVLTV